MPSTFEYKPIAFEALAGPLSKMQEKYDLTKTALEDSDFTIDALKGSNEGSRAAEISAEFKKAKKELVTNLQKTGNYELAAKRLKELNKLYNKDPEIVAQRTNKQNFLEADKEMRKRVAKGKNTETEYQDWLRAKRMKFEETGGTAFNRETGQYNTIDTQLRSQNLEKEILDFSIGIAKGAAVDYHELYGKEVGQEIEKVKISGKDHATMTAKIYDILKTSKRYQDWANEEAEYEYYKDVENYPGGRENFNNDILRNYNETLNNSIADYEKMLTDGVSLEGVPLSKEDKINVKNLLENSKQNLDIFNSYGQAGISRADLDNVAKQIYISQNNKTQEMAQVTSAPFAYKKIEHDLVNEDDGTGRRKATKEDKEQVEKVNKFNITQKLSNNTQKPSVGREGGSGSSATLVEGSGGEVFDVMNSHLTNTNPDKFNPEFKKDYDIFLNSIEGLPPNSKDIYVQSAQKTIKNINLISGVQDYIKTHDNHISELKKEYQDLTEKLKVGGTDSEIKELEAKRIRIGNDLRSTERIKTAELNELEQIVIKGPHDEFKKKYYDFNEDLEKTLEWARIENEKAFKSFESEKRFITDKEGNPILDPETGDKMEFLTPIEKPLSQLEQEVIAKYKAAGVPWQVEPGKIKLTGFQTSEYNFPESPIGSTIMNRWYKSLGEKFDLTIPEVIINEGALTMTTAPGTTDSELTKLTDALSILDDAARIPVKFDGINVKRYSDEHPIDNYNLDSYDLTEGKVILVGATQDMGTNGEEIISPIIKLTRKNKYDVSTEEGRAAIRKLLGDIAKTKNSDITDAQLSQAQSIESLVQWAKTNPQTITLKINATNFNPMRPAKDNYYNETSKLINIVNNSNNDTPYWNSFEGQELRNRAETGIKRMTDSYVALELVFDKDVKKQYTEIAASLNIAQRDENTKIQIEEQPAAWDENLDGSFSGYMLKYRYDLENKGIVMDVWEVTHYPDDLNKEVQYKQISTQPIIGNKPSILRANALIYGTGNKGDLIENPYNPGKPFVQAFHNLPN